jgi:hypothetical protein
LSGALEGEADFASEYSNHTLLRSLLESINAIIEHQYASNANSIYAVLRSKKKIEALRIFTLESGQEEIERIARRRKEILGGASNLETSLTPLPHEPSSALSRTSTSTLPNVPEEDGAFAIGDLDDSHNEDHRPTTDSRRSSIATDPALAEFLNKTLPSTTPHPTIATLLYPDTDPYPHI